MHIKQRRILRKLVSLNAQRYCELYQGFDYDDKFPYHLKYLVENNFVAKREGRYLLTGKGMHQTAYFDSRSLEEFRFKLPLVVFICNYKERYFLKDHFGDDATRESFYSLPMGVIPWGEGLEEGCSRLLKEKYDIKGRFEYRSTCHSIFYAKNKTVLFDDLFLVYDVQVTSKPKKMNYWYKKNEIMGLPKRYKLIDVFVLRDNSKSLVEVEIVEDYGFVSLDNSRNKSKLGSGKGH
ncbi:MAG: hypothetical protein PHS44_06965 [Candidatus Dojkabacteria bacterium]|nr:hypothetical protein [Candidatus Dojkabacteria bacterium]